MADTQLVDKGELGDIGFVEFTVGLINGVIDALISANAKQIQSFSELLAESAKTLAEYSSNRLGVTLPITETAALTNDQIVQIATLVPLVTVSSVEYHLLTSEGVPSKSTTAPLGAFRDSFMPVSADVAAAINAALLAAASNEYQVLQQMVKLGFSRIVLDSGVIETRLTFTASKSQSTLNQATSSSVQSKSSGVSGGASTQGKLAKYLALSVSANSSKVSINMANQIHRDVSNSGSSVQIFGRVELHLKSDYLPLSK